MPEYKLTYFNGRGMGELIRWIFLYGNMPFTQERVELSEWPERKKGERRLPKLCFCVYGMSLSRLSVPYTLPLLT